MAEDDGYQNIADVLQGYLGSTLSRGLSENQKAARAWYAANGDIERKHTTGVYLKKSKAKGAAPILCVYVDSHARMVDFSVNREVYLLRLASYGLSVSGVEFKLSKTPKKQDAARQGSAAAASMRGTAAAAKQKPPLPELSASEEKGVEDMTSALPDEIRGKVARAVELSMRREKSQNTNGGTTAE